MPKKIIVLDAPIKSGKTSVWWKVGKYFIHQENIRSISRKGKHSLMRLFHGDDVIVHVNYDKLQILLPSDNKSI